MATHVFNYAKQQILNGGIDLDTDDIRVILCMTNTDADTVNDAIDTVNDITLDECDGTNYVRKALASEAVNLDDGNDRAEFDAADVVWTALGAGARATQGMLVIKHVTDDTDSIPICFLDFDADETHNGTDFTVEFNAEGILQAAGIYNYACQQLLNGGIDLDTDDIRVILCCTNTDADTVNDGINTVNDIALDEHDGANYVRKALASEAVNLDDANDRAEFDAADVTWTALGHGTRQIEGVLVYKHVTDDTDSIPICFLDPTNEMDLTVTFDAEGILQAA